MQKSWIANANSNDKHKMWDRLCKVQCKLKHWRSIWSFDGSPCCSLSKIGAVYGCSSQGTVSMTILILFCSVEMMMRKRRWKLNSKLRTLSDCKTWNFVFSERLKLVFKNVTRNHRMCLNGILLFPLYYLYFFLQVTNLSYELNNTEIVSL